MVNHICGLLQDCSISCALAMELLQTRSKLSIYTFSCMQLNLIQIYRLKKTTITSVSNICISSEFKKCFQFNDWNPVKP